MKNLEEILVGKTIESADIDLNEIIFIFKDGSILKIEMEGDTSGAAFQASIGD